MKHLPSVTADQSSGLSKSLSQMVQSGGLLRLWHKCGLPSLRSLCRLMPAWISLCARPAGSKGIYLLFCAGLLSKYLEVSPSLAVLDWTVGELEANLAVLGWSGCDRAADARGLDLGIVSYCALTLLIKSLLCIVAPGESSEVFNPLHYK